jgi:flagellar biosynthesis chaperone FliJ
MGYELVKFHENSKKHLQQEIENFREEAKKQRKIIYQLEKERDQYIQKASDFTHQVCVLSSGRL